MKSLAILVAILLLLALISGPIAFAMTRIQTTTRRGEIIKRILIVLLTLLGTLIGVNFAMAHVPFVVRLIGIFSVAISLYAVRIEFGAPKKPREY